MELFEHDRINRQRQGAPLAGRMTPKVLSDLAGQELIVGEGKVLRRDIESDQVPSLVPVSYTHLTLPTKRIV